MLSIESIPRLSTPVKICQHYTVPDHNSLEVDLILRLGLSVVAEDLIGQIGDVHTTVRFTCDPEVPPLELWESIEPLDQRKIGIGRSVVLVVLKTLVFILRESHSWRVLKEQDMSIVVPSIRVQSGIEGSGTRLHQAGTNLLGESFINVKHYQGGWSIRVLRLAKAQ